MPAEGDGGMGMKEVLDIWGGLAWPPAVLGGAIVIGLIGHFVLFRIAGFFSRRTEAVFDDSLARHFRGPSRIIIPALTVSFLIPLMNLSPAMQSLFRQAIGLLLIASVAWLIIKALYVLEDVVVSRFRVDVADNLRARAIQTQFQIFKKVAIVVIWILALASILMTFDKVRHLGTSILASAGIAGIIIGLAAQRTIATLLAGIQVAITQPIRLDDVVVVEGEWGRIEEITLTFVVIRIWDLRRLVLPITYFLEKPVQNWTRVSAEVLGTAFIYVDYTVPLEALRQELRRIVENSASWDGKVCVLHVTNATERTVELRALMSAPDSSKAWDLRCEVREKLIDFIQKNYPDGLPKVRGEFTASEKDAALFPVSDTQEKKGKK
jgi:small-conductance mechanosensitive channel